MYIFVRPIFDLVFLKTGESGVPTKIYMADLNSPRRAVFVGYLGSAVALTVAWQIDFFYLQAKNYYLSLFPW